MFPNMNCRLHQAKIWDHLKSSEIISAPNPVLCPSCRYTPGAGRSPPIPGHRRSWAMPGPGPAAPSVTGTWPGPWCFQRFRNYGETMTMMKKSRKTGGGTTNYQPPTWEFALRPSCICMSMAGLSDYLLCSAFFPSGQGSRRLNLICSPCFGWAQGSAKTLQTCKLHCHIFPKWCPHDSIIQKKMLIAPMVWNLLH